MKSLSLLAGGTVPIFMLVQLLPSVGGLCERFGPGLEPTTECRTWSGSKTFRHSDRVPVRIFWKGCF